MRALSPSAQGRAQGRGRGTRPGYEAKGPRLRQHAGVPNASDSRRALRLGLGAEAGSRAPGLGLAAARRGPGKMRTPMNARPLHNAPQSRMQFNYLNFQYSPQTLQFQRHHFNVSKVYMGIACDIVGEPSTLRTAPDATTRRFSCDGSAAAPRRRRLTCNDSRHTATSATISTRYPFITSHRDPRSNRSPLTSRHRAQTAVHLAPNTPFPTHFAEVDCTLSNPRGILQP